VLVITVPSFFVPPPFVSSLANFGFALFSVGCCPPARKTLYVDGVCPLAVQYWQCLSRFFFVFGGLDSVLRAWFFGLILDVTSSSSTVSSSAHCMILCQYTAACYFHEMSLDLWRFSFRVLFLNRPLPYKPLFQHSSPLRDDNGA